MVLGLIEKAYAVLCSERLLKIRPDKLLMLADDPQFCDGRFVTTFKKSHRTPAAVSREATLSRLIITHYANKTRRAS